MNELLEVNNIVKSFGGQNIVDNISLTLEKGRVLGILGPNGQGKTTLLNLIAGLYKPTSGSIKVNGILVGYETKKIVSYLQEKDYINKWMTVNDAINFYKDFFEDFDEGKLNELIISMKLDRKSKVKTLSKGMVEKLGLILTLSRKSKLYILDEPISGVDTITRDKIVNTIINNLDEETSMIITTHYVGELENLFDDVIFIGEGSVIEKGQAEDLREKYGTSIDEIYRKVFAE
ncbi:MAG: ABC transporter ATP-binding protein [Clostridium sp.]